MSNGIRLTFWGVRGSIPTPGPGNLGFGGNTACVEVRLPGGELVILDGGTGARPLGEKLNGEAGGDGLDLHFFLTHFHWDHIHGIPFFLPLYDKRNKVRFYAATSPAVTERHLAGQLAAPYFPVEAEVLLAGCEFIGTGSREILLGESRIASFLLNHPQGCHGYRIRHGASTLVFATDCELGHPEYDRILMEAAQGAEVLVLDAQYTPEEYEKYRGRGHGTWLQATRFAAEAGVGRLILFHHDPGHDDHAMRRILADARTNFSETAVATELDEIELG